MIMYCLRPLCLVNFLFFLKINNKMISLNRLFFQITLLYKASHSTVRACRWQFVVDDILLGHEMAGKGSVCGKEIQFQKGKMTEAKRGCHIWFIHIWEARGSVSMLDSTHALSPGIAWLSIYPSQYLHSYTKTEPHSAKEFFSSF